jgi:hypothetical protein
MTCQTPVVKGIVRLSGLGFETRLLAILSTNFNGTLGNLTIFSGYNITGLFSIGPGGDAFIPGIS